MLFYTKTIPVKMLPFDNKPEFSVMVNMPEGTALPETANVVHQLARKVREIPEVTAVQAYAGTAQPFNFNGMVRHYYLRERPWEGDLLVMLKDKKERDRGSHEIAVAARHLLTPLARNMGAKIAVVEMPPGPPVLQTVVAEVYGPDEQTRRMVAADMTRMFEDVENIVDADNYMAEPYEYWRFEVDTEKTVRRGISVDTINRNLAMAMGGFQIGDVKRGTVLEPTYIVIQIPLASRSHIHTLASLPIRSEGSGMVLLAELGRFVKMTEDPIIYHKDLRPMEYVVGEMEGRLGAPIYGMFGVEDLLEGYKTPDGVQITGMPWGLIAPPDEDSVSGFEWTGEWTVTYETFRDMGLAFMAALVLIYGLIVWEFRNFALAGLIMSPIPLTLIGIVPGHLIMGAEFTATSMIGMIALGGIIVRQSILIVEFVKIEVAKGKSVREAAVAGAEIRMRPIFITSLTLMAGAWAIINDPIFQGMAVSLLFGAGVATVMAVIVIPLGCISARKQFYLEETESGEIELSGRFAEVEEVAASTAPVNTSSTPLWMRVWSTLFTIGTWTYRILRALVLVLLEPIRRLLQRFRKKAPPTPPTGAPPTVNPGGGTPGTGAGPASGPDIGGPGPQGPVPAPSTAAKANTTTAAISDKEETKQTPPVEKDDENKAATGRRAGNKSAKNNGGATRGRKKTTKKARMSKGNGAGTESSDTPPSAASDTAKSAATAVATRGRRRQAGASTRKKQPTQPGLATENTAQQKNAAAATATPEQTLAQSKNRSRPTRLGIRLKKGEHL